MTNQNSIRLEFRYRIGSVPHKLSLFPRSGKKKLAVNSEQTLAQFRQAVNTP